MHEAGSRETAIVEAGPVRFICEPPRPGRGDSVTFDADLPHHFENPGEGEARFYAVVAAA